ncbi:MAG: SUMF1/EgtB/PvdO family nonheme iron enzyme [Myxococcales bacterium]
MAAGGAGGAGWRGDPGPQAPVARRPVQTGPQTSIAGLIGTFEPPHVAAAKPQKTAPSPLVLGAVGTAVLALVATPIVWVISRSPEAPTAASSSSASVASAPVDASVQPRESGPPQQSVRARLLGNMVALAGGKVTMGWSNGNADEKPPREVSIAAFSLDRTEVTLEAWQLCVSEKACPPAPTEVSFADMSEQDKAYSNYCNGRAPMRSSHPINCVTWEEASQFCTWAGKRLPTEEEWEYAARGESTGLWFPWGKEPPGPSRLNACGKECVEALRALKLTPPQPLYAESDGFEGTAPVNRRTVSQRGTRHRELRTWEATCPSGHRVCMRCTANSLRQGRHGG